MDRKKLIHILRNPYGYSESEKRGACLEVADLLDSPGEKVVEVCTCKQPDIELLEKDLKAWEDSAKGFEKLGLNECDFRETAKIHKNIAYGFSLALNIIKQYPKGKYKNGNINNL